MKITIESVAALNPCESRFNNFKNSYPGFDGDFNDFIALKDITYNDKVWVAIRLLSKNQLVRWSIMCAESVRDKYESKYPDSKVLANLFDYLNNIDDFENLSKGQREQIKELWAISYAATYAADAAADAASDAADAATYAADAAASDAAAAVYYADAATTYAAAAASAQEEQRNLNLLCLASVIKE